MIKFLSLFCISIPLLLMCCTKESAPDEAAKPEPSPAEEVLFVETLEARPFVDPPRDAKDFVPRLWPTEHLGFSKSEYGEVMVSLFMRAKLKSSDFDRWPLLERVSDQHFSERDRDQLGYPSLDTAIENQTQFDVENRETGWAERLYLGRVQWVKRELKFDAIRAWRKPQVRGYYTGLQYPSVENSSHISIYFGASPSAIGPTYEELEAILAGSGVDAKLAALEKAYFSIGEAEKVEREKAFLSTGVYPKAHYLEFIVARPDSNPFSGRPRWAVSGFREAYDPGLWEYACWQLAEMLPARTPIEHLCVAAWAFRARYACEWWKREVVLSSDTPYYLAPLGFSKFARKANVSDQRKLYLYSHLYRKPIGEGKLEEYEGCLLPPEVIIEREKMAATPGYIGPLKPSTLEGLTWVKLKKSILDEAKLLKDQEKSKTD